MGISLGNGTVRITVKLYNSNILEAYQFISYLCFVSFELTEKVVMRSGEQQQMLRVLKGRSKAERDAST